MPLDQFGAYFFYLKQHVLNSSGEKKKIFGTSRKAFLARFGVHFFWAIFDYKTGDFLTFSAKM